MSAPPATRWQLLTLVALVIAALSPGASAIYVGSDDAAFFLLREEAAPFLKIAGDGRPLLAGLYWLSLRAVESIEELRWLRWLYVLEVGTLTGALAWWASRRGFSVLESSTLALVATLSPGMVELVSWTPSCWTPLGIAAALASASCARRASARDAIQVRLAWCVAGACLLCAAWAVYQPSGMWWVAFAVVTLLDRRRAPLKRWAADFALVAATAGALYVGIVLGLIPALLDAPPAGRGRVTHAPALKLVWFAAMPLRDVLNLSCLWSDDPVVANGLFGAHADRSMTRMVSALAHPAYVVATVVGGLVVAASWAATAGAERRRWLLASLFAAVPMAYAPNLVIESFWSPFRTQTAMYTVVVVVLVAGLRTRRSRRWAGAVLALWAAFAWVGALNISQRWVAAPLSAEWEHLRVQSAQVEPAQLAAGAETITFRPGPLEAAYAPGVRYELGRPASSPAWAHRPMVMLARDPSARASANPSLRVKVLEDCQAAAPPPQIALGCDACAPPTPGCPR